MRLYAAILRLGMKALPLPQTGAEGKGQRNAMMNIDLTDATAWEAEKGGEHFVALIPFSHQRLPSGCLRVEIICADAPFGEEDRKNARHCVADLARRVDDLAVRLSSYFGQAAARMLAVERGSKTLFSYAGQPGASILAVGDADTRAVVFAQWKGDELVRMWGQDRGDPHPAWHVSERAQGQLG